MDPSTTSPAIPRDRMSTDKCWIKLELFTTSKPYIRESVQTPNHNVWVYRERFSHDVPVEEP